MPRRCSICSDEQRIEIEKQILSSVPYRDIESTFGVGRMAVKRHHENGHISEALMKATEIEQIVDADDLMGQLRYLQKSALDILEEAKKAKNQGIALSAIARAGALIETQAKLLGKLADVTVKIDVMAVAREAAVWWKERYPKDFKQYVEHLDRKYASIHN